MSRFPPSWLCSVRVVRGGRDQAGNPGTGELFDVDRCLVTWPTLLGSEDGPAWDEQPSDRAILYVDHATDPDGTVFAERDMITVPPGPWPSGRWQVDGRPMPYPNGTVVRLRRRI